MSCCAVLLLSSCDRSGGDVTSGASPGQDKRTVRNGDQNPSHGSPLDFQQKFELARIGKFASYMKAKNEIQESAIFNSANDDTNGIVAANGAHVENWSGTIDSLKIIHGGTATSVTIKSRHGVSYQIENDVVLGSKIYNQLALIDSGQYVTFSGVLKRDPISKKIVRNISRIDSLSNPEFKMAFDSIEHYDEKSVPSMSNMASMPGTEVAALDAVR